MNTKPFHDLLAGGKQLGGNLNLVALLPEVFSAALEAELEQASLKASRAEHRLLWKD